MLICLFQLSHNFGHLLAVRDRRGLVDLTFRYHNIAARVVHLRIEDF